MPDFITLTCPTCGGKLQITDKISTFACGHCGNEHIVHREGGAVYLAPLAQDVRHIRTGVDKTAAELAVARLSKEVATLESELNEVMAITDDEWAGGLTAVKVLAVFGVFLLIYSLQSANIFMFLLQILIAIGALWLAFKTYQDRKNKIESLRNAEVERINALLDPKYAQLEKNRRIAEG
jgi:predicted RNA-binding Zn-ribbon protein involved in translation (DUF1610 family)